MLASLVENNVLLKGNYNKSATERTRWYAFVDENRFVLPFFKNEKSNFQNENEVSEMKNGFSENEKSTFSKTEKCLNESDNKPVNKPDKEEDINAAALPSSSDLVYFGKDRQTMDFYLITQWGWEGRKVTSSGCLALIEAARKYGKSEVEQRIEKFAIMSAEDRNVKHVLDSLNKMEKSQQAKKREDEARAEQRKEREEVNEFVTANSSPEFQEELARWNSKIKLNSAQISDKELRRQREYILKNFAGPS